MTQSCPACDAPTLKPSGDLARTCDTCRATVSRCDYCDQVTLHHGEGVRTCLNRACAGHGVPWRRCEDCGSYRVPVLSMAGPFVCIDGSHTMLAVIRCLACDHERRSPAVCARACSRGPSA